MILQEGLEEALEKLAEEQMALLKPVEDSWQPADFLPDSSAPGWRERVEEVRTRAAALPDDLLVVLAGNSVTEEALPSYQTWLNRSEVLNDRTGASASPWARWTRGWTAEENRHGDLLNRYLYLSGRVNMRAFEITTHHLIRNGFDPLSGNDSFRALVYVSFQERATRISHANVGAMAEKNGDRTLARICTAIAGDEARHEEFYKRFFRGVLQMDPSAGVIAFADMMKRRIGMPARLMSDGVASDLFSQFAVVAQRTRTYTFGDYVDVLRHLIEFWDIGALSGLSPEAEASRDYLCRLPVEYRPKADRFEQAVRTFPKAPFEWIHGRSA